MAKWTLTDDAQAGQRAARNNVAIVPRLYSSPAWMAFMAGKQLSEASEILRARMSRGYSVKLETASNTYIVHFDKRDLHKITVERKG